MLLTWALLILGFVFLIKGADLLVDGASSLAKRFGVSALVIGLTIVAFGTSMPELIVNIFASINGNTDIAIGNVLGSNIANILLILGVSAVVFPLAVGRGTVWKEIPFSLLAVLVLFIVANDALVDGATFSSLTRSDAFMLLAFFLIFMYYIFSISKDNAGRSQEDVEEYSILRSISFVFLGMIGLTLGGKWIVDSAVIIATSFGVSQALVGLTIVAIGTSLPELVTSAVAAFRRNTDIAIGNVVGSNIFNIFWILGISAFINPIPFSGVGNRDMFVAIGSTVILFVILFIGKRHEIERWQGVLFILLYLIYITYIVLKEIHVA